MKSFRDPVTNVLKCWGYIETNGSDIPREEPPGFTLEPGKWKLSGNAWVPHVAVRVPAEVTRFQAIAALTLRGHMPAVNALLDHPDTPELYRLAFKEALTFKRTSPTVLAIGAQLSIDLDDIFTFAETIDA